MSFSYISFHNYRNLKNNYVRLKNKEIFLIGENGQGKTNFLELIYFLCFGSSFRTKNDRHICLSSESEFLVSGKFVDIEGIENEIKIVFRNKKKEIRFNDKIIKDRKEIIQNIPCIIFSYKDMILVHGSPDNKRYFFDQTLSLFDFLYLDNLRRYKKFLKTRNILLKEKNRDILSIIDRQLVEEGLYLQETRRKLVEEFNQTCQILFEQIFDNKLQIEYFPSWKGNKEDVIAFLEEKKDHDFRYGQTTTGPHRDNFRFTSLGKDFALEASTGQTRMLSLFLKIAQAKFYTLKTKRNPILLLDDVLLELDEKKREQFIQNIPEYNQAFFTFLPDERFLKYKTKSTKIYTIHQGSFFDYA